MWFKSQGLSLLFDNHNAFLRKQILRQKSSKDNKNLSNNTVLE